MTLQQLENKVKILEGRLCCGKPVFYPTFVDFPATGKDNTLYVDEETASIYIWNGTEYITAPSEPKYIFEDILPSTIDNGELILYNGELWRGLLEGESSLSAGTPWPVKGYKQWIAEINLNLGAVSLVTVINNSLGNVVFSKFGASYRAVLTGAFFSNKTFGTVLIGISSNYLNDIIYNVDSTHPSRFSLAFTSTSTQSVLSDITTNTPMKIKIEVYPPAP